MTQGALHCEKSAGSNAGRLLQTPESLNEKKKTRNSFEFRVFGSRFALPVSRMASRQAKSI